MTKENEDDVKDAVDDQEEADKADDASEADAAAAATEARARKQGWRPEAEWDDARAEREGRRKPTRFMSADEYLERIDNETPILRERNRRLEQNTEKLTKEVGELKKQTSELSDLLRTQHTMGLEAKKKAYDRGILDEKARQRAAVKEGDTEAFDDSEAKIKQLETEKRELEKVPDKTDDDQDEGDKKPDKKAIDKREVDVDDETKDWIDANKKWFTSDGTLNNYMIEMNGKVRQEHPDWSITDQLDEAKKRTMDKFPEKFGKNPARGGKGAVGQSGNRTDDKNSRRFDALPDDAKKAYEGFKRQFKTKGVEYSKDEYLADYHQGE